MKLHLLKESAFTALVYVLTARLGQQESVWVPINGQIGKNIKCVSMIEFYSAIKKNAILLHARYNWNLSYGMKLTITR